MAWSGWLPRFAALVTQSCVSPHLRLSQVGFVFRGYPALEPRFAALLAWSCVSPAGLLLAAFTTRSCISQLFWLEAAFENQRYVSQLSLGAAIHSFKRLGALFCNSRACWGLSQCFAALGTWILQLRAAYCSSESHVAAHRCVSRLRSHIFVPLVALRRVSRLLRLIATFCCSERLGAAFGGSHGLESRFAALAVFAARSSVSRFGVARSRVLGLLWLAW